MKIIKYLIYFSFFMVFGFSIENVHASNNSLPNWEYLGCFADGFHRDMPGYHFNDRHMTHKKCQYECYERHYRFAGLQFHKHHWIHSCRCSDSFGIHGLAHSIGSHCRCPTAGGIEQFSGCSYQNRVYNVGPSLCLNYTCPAHYKCGILNGEPKCELQPGKGWEYLGCYRDKRHNRDISDYSFTSDQMTNELCHDACYEKKFQFAGLSLDTCYCGKSYGKHGQSGNCECHAIGDELQYVGCNNWENRVYNLWDEPVFGQHGICHLPNNITLKVGETHITSDCTLSYFCESELLLPGMTFYSHCHHNATCIIENNEPVCICKNDYEGDGYVDCKIKEKVEVIEEIGSNEAVKVFETIVENNVCYENLCFGLGDPHYTSIFKHEFEVDNVCSYILAADKCEDETPKYSIIMDHEHRNNNTEYTYMKAVRIIYNGVTYKIQEKKFYISGYEQSLPYITSDFKVIRLTKRNKIMFKDYSRFTVVFDSYNYMRMKVCEPLKCGICLLDKEKLESFPLSEFISDDTPCV